MTTDVLVQFLKLPETEKSDNQAHNVPLIPIPSFKPEVAKVLENFIGSYQKELFNQKQIKNTKSGLCL